LADDGGGAGRRQGIGAVRAVQLTVYFNVAVSMQCGLPARQSATVVDRDGGKRGRGTLKRLRNCALVAKSRHVDGVLKLSA